MKNNLIRTKSLLVVGATGLIGSSIFKYFSDNDDYIVFGAIRNPSDKRFFSSSQVAKLNTGMQAFSHHKWNQIFKKIRPDIVINCLGVTKHLACGDDPLVTIPINAYFPHYLNALCQEYRARLIHISSDCVFSGKSGNYSEDDTPDAEDFYGRTKALGEITQGSGVTLRTSTIGHELRGRLGLLEWFLCQNGSCVGYKNAFFSGISTLELARIIEQFVIPNPQLQGLYHVGAKKISKFNLLTKISQEYGKKIKIISNTTFKVDRSLNSNRFYNATGYKPPSWEQLIKEMHLSK